MSLRTLALTADDERLVMAARPALRHVPRAHQRLRARRMGHHPVRGSPPRKDAVLDLLPAKYTRADASTRTSFIELERGVWDDFAGELAPAADDPRPMRVSLKARNTFM